jgi:hypothetical protein
LFGGGPSPLLGFVDGERELSTIGSPTAVSGSVQVPEEELVEAVQVRQAAMNGADLAPTELVSAQDDRRVPSWPRTRRRSVARWGAVVPSPAGAVRTSSRAPVHHPW